VFFAIYRPDGPAYNPKVIRRTILCIISAKKTTKELRERWETDSEAELWSRRVFRIPCHDKWTLDSASISHTTIDQQHITSSIVLYGRNFRGAGGRSDQCSEKAQANKKVLSLDFKTEGVASQNCLWQWVPDRRYWNQKTHLEKSEWLDRMLFLTAWQNIESISVHPTVVNKLFALSLSSALVWPTGQMRSLSYNNLSHSNVGRQFRQQWQICLNKTSASSKRKQNIKIYISLI